MFRYHQYFQKICLVVVVAVSVVLIIFVLFNNRKFRKRHQSAKQMRAPLLFFFAQLAASCSLSTRDRGHRLLERSETQVDQGIKIPEEIRFLGVHNCDARPTLKQQAEMPSERLCACLPCPQPQQYIICCLPFVPYRFSVHTFASTKSTFWSYDTFVLVQGPKHQPLSTSFTKTNRVTIRALHLFSLDSQNNNLRRANHTSFLLSVIFSNVSLP